jgi:hypothetical protein
VKISTADLREQVAEKKELKLEVENLRLQVEKMELESTKAARTKQGAGSPHASSEIAPAPRGKVRF